MKFISNYFTAVFNLVIFLPYFFSVPKLLKTLFSPWKNLISKKKTVGFSFNASLSNLSFNLISRFIGFSMRLSILTFYFIVQIMLIIILPIMTIIFFLLLPLFFIISLFRKSELEKKDSLKKKFIQTHLLDQTNLSYAEIWFENYYQKYLHKTEWWRLSQLFSIPPLARDWAVGYTPTLDQYCDDMTKVSYQGRIKNIVDRQNEIGRLERILLKSEGANALIAGEEGVGKKTVIDAFSKKIYEGTGNPLLSYKRIIKLNLEKILSQFDVFEKREEFLETLFKEASEAKNIIIVIENFDKYIFNDQGRIDLTTSIEKYIKSSEIQVIGITTPFFYQKYIFPNEKISRYFEKLDINEINLDEAEKILLNIALEFEKKYNLVIPYETIKNTLEKSNFFITYIPFPEKAIELLDNACVYTLQSLKKNTVLPEIIDKVLTEKTHTPTIVSDDMKNKLVHLESLLHTQIVSQNEAIDEISKALRRSFILIGKRKKPLAAFLFLGSTGVGKTQTAKAIAQAFFDSEDKLIRFDMSFFQSKNDIPKLIGSAETNDPGLLTKTIRENPYGVLLLDEIEKADKDLLNIFLTVLDEGYFTDSLGKRVDCKNLIIIATSNAVSDFFAPEFLNRFDGVITYKPLDNNDFLEIGLRKIEKIKNDIYNLHKIKLQINRQFVEQLISKNHNPEFGARNLDRILRDEVEDKVARLLLENKVKAGDIINF